MMKAKAVKMNKQLVEKGKTVELVERKGSRPRAPKVDNGKDPISIFPEEVWRLIFGYLKEPQDLKNCYETCVMFMLMLKEKRSTFLFLDVLQVLQNKDHEINLISHNPPRMNLAEMISCRQVCYGWKQSVDNFLQETSPPINEPVDDISSVPTALKFNRTQNPWTSDSSLRNLSADINPMVSRTVILAYGWPTQLQEVTLNQNAFREFVQKFGHHVWYFKVCFTPDGLSFASWYASLLTWLRLMPNLKALHFFHLDYQVGSSALTRCLEQNPFPTLPSLISVAVDSWPVSVLRSVLTANPNIERLLFVGSRLTPGNANSFQLDKLKELTLNHASFTLKNLLNVNWNLSKLTLEDAPLGKWSKLFRALEMFAGTLTELDLKMDGPSEEPRLRLNLPNLCELKLKITQCFNSIDFILPLINLERLKVELTYMYRLDDMDSDSSFDVGVEICEYVPIAKIKEKVQFHGFIQDLRKSNIWRLLPNLKKIMARSDHFERDLCGGGCLHGWEEGSGEDEEEEGIPATPLYNTEWKYCSRNQVEF